MPLKVLSVWHINTRISQTQLQHYIKIRIGGEYFNIMLELCLTDSSADIPLLLFSVFLITPVSSRIHWNLHIIYIYIYIYINSNGMGHTRWHTNNVAEERK
jgi:hypothetical protein